MDIRKSLDIYFSLVKDTRSRAHITYEMEDILFMLVCGMLCNCTDLEMIVKLFE